MAKGQLKVGIVSAGMIANNGHIPAYRNLGDRVAVEAVCDIDLVAARETAERHGIRGWYGDVGKMLEAERPDLVSVCTPNATHRALVELALEAGCDVICEKPVALTYADARALYELAARKGRTLVACQTLRFNREYFAAKEYVESGMLGHITYGEVTRVRRRGMPRWGAFHKKAASGGGAFADIGVHFVDSALWILGSPKVLAVSGMRSSDIVRNERGVVYSLKESGAYAGVARQRTFDPADCDVEEFASGMIRLEGDLCLHFTIAWAANMPETNRMLILGDKMGIRMPEMELYGTLGRNQADSAPRLFELGAYDGRPFAGHCYLVQNVVGHILDGIPLVVRPEETLNVAAAIDLFYRSCEEGREIPFGSLR